MSHKWKYTKGLDSENPYVGPFAPKGIQFPKVPDASEVTPGATYNGLMWYDSTNNTFQGIANGGEVTLATAAGVNPTADDVYNNGAWTVTVDAGACTYASNQAGANVLVLSEANAAGTGSLIDLSHARAASKDIDGTSSLWYVTAGGAGTFASLTATDGTFTNATITNLTLGAVDGFNLTGNCTFTTSATTGSGLLLDGSTVTSGNVLRIEADAVNLNSGYFLNCTLDTTSKFTVAEDGALAIAGTAAGSNAIAITAGDVTLTSGHVVLTDGNLTLSSGGLDVLVGAGDGDAIDVTPIATGAGVDLNLPAAYNLASGAIDIDGSTGSGPVVEIAMSGAYTGDYLSLDMTNAVGAKAVDITGAGVRTAYLVHITDTPDNAVGTFNLDITPANGAIVMDWDIAGVSNANIVDMAFAAAHTGTAFEINMTNAVGAKAFNLTGAGARTTPLFVVTDVPANGAATFDLNVTGSHANGHTFDIDEAGTSTNNCVDWACAGAYAGDVINITMTNAAAAAQALVIDGGQTAASGNIVDISSSSAFAAGTGKLMALTSSGNLAAATNGAVLTVSETGAAQATSYAISVASTNNEALLVDTGKSRFDEEVTFKQSNRNFIHPNYIAAAGVNNAITGTLTDSDGANVPLADGLIVVVDLQALTLQAGVNTFNLNAGGALSIVSHYNVANNIGTAYAAQSHVMLCYNAGATAWEDMSQ